MPRRRNESAAQLANERLARLIRAGIESPDVEGFDIKVVIARLKRSIREGEESGEPVSWNPQTIKNRARCRIRNKG